MKWLALSMMLMGGALLSSYSSQAQGRRDHDNRGYNRGNGYGHGGQRYEREYRRDYHRGPREVVYYEGYRPAPVVCEAPVVYAAPCPPPPPRRIYYPRGPRVVIAAGPVVVGF
jgi:hypothetical protein